MSPVELQLLAATGRSAADASARLPILVGVVIIALFFGAFGTWAALSPLNGAVVGEGVVSVEGNRKSVDHLEGGIVRELHVRDGDDVGVGDVLLVLDDGRLRAQVDILSQQVALARAAEARLLAEREGAEAISFPDDLTESTLDYVVEARNSETEAFAARQQSYVGSQDVLGHRIRDLGEQISGARQRLVSLDEQLASLQAEKTMVDALFARGLSTNERPLQLQRSVASTRSQISDASTSIASAQVNIAEFEQQIRQLSYERQTQVAADLAAVQQRLLDLGPNLATARAALDRVVVRSPYEGRVVGLKVFSVGEVVPAGATLMEIVPRQTSLVISTQFRVEDIADLQVGSAAEVHFTSMTRLYVPVLHGTVTHLSADRLTDERSGFAYYRGEVVINSSELEPNAQIQLYPGMPATVMVATQDRTALEYLLGPLVAAFDSAFRQG